MLTPGENGYRSGNVMLTFQGLGKQADTLLQAASVFAKPRMITFSVYW